MESLLYDSRLPQLLTAQVANQRCFGMGRGFFGKSSRVSAVVFHTRHVSEGKIENRWRVFPTNRPNKDTIQLEAAELNLFGDLEDRDSLSAENLPETLSSSSEDPLEN